MLTVRFIACLGALVLGALPLRAQVSATVAVGYFTSTVAAGTGSGTVSSVLSFPLLRLAAVAGQTAGPVSGVAANTVTVAGAGWTPGQLSQAAAPYLLRFTSGNAAGRTFLLSTTAANTATVVTLDPDDALGTDLTTLGIAAGDTYQLLPANTLAGVFGTASAAGVLGGAGGPANCDLVQLLQPGGWTAYYFDTTVNHWIRASPPHLVADNEVIRPDTGVIYNRYAASAFAVTLTGAVPSVPRQAAVLRSGPTALANNWPTNLTLQGSLIQSMPGWTAGASVGVADTVQVYDSSSHGWSQYFYDGTNWRLGTAPYSVSDGVILPAGTMVLINKTGGAAGHFLLSQPVPYSLVPAQ